MANCPQTAINWGVLDDGGAEVDWKDDTATNLPAGNRLKYERKPDYQRGGAGKYFPEILLMCSEGESEIRLFIWDLKIRGEKWLKIDF